MIYDNKLNWNFNIEHIITTVKKCFGIFKILGQLLDIELLRSIYFSMVNSIISYGIWDGTFKTHIRLLYVPQWPMPMWHG